MVNTTIARILKNSDLSDTRAQQQWQLACSRTQSLVDDICASVPFHFDSIDMVEHNMLSNAVEQELTRSSSMGDSSDTVTRHACLMTLPLIQAQAAEGILDYQRAWISSKLLLVSRATGINVLEIAGVVSSLFSYQTSLFVSRSVVCMMRENFLH